MNRRLIIAVALVAVLGVTAPAWANVNTPSGTGDHCEEDRVEHASGATGSCATTTTTTRPSSSTTVPVITLPTVIITTTSAPPVTFPATPVCPFDGHYDARTFECDMAEVLSRVATGAPIASAATPTPMIPAFTG